MVVVVFVVVAVVVAVVAVVVDAVVVVFVLDVPGFVCIVSLYCLFLIECFGTDLL